MNKLLYPCFNWPGNIWLYSDPHFGSNRYISDEDQIKSINSKVGKFDTLVILGDIGDIECVKKLKGYKVLIQGNHDAGASKYKKEVSTKYITTDKKNFKILDSDNTRVNLKFNNNLFDEVYTGCLIINKKIILSHEPVQFDYAFNIHGHDHSLNEFMTYVLKYYDSDMSRSDMLENYIDVIKTEKLTHLNIVAELINFTPVSLKKLIEAGLFSNVNDIHKTTIHGRVGEKSESK